MASSSQSSQGPQTTRQAAVNSLRSVLKQQGNNESGWDSAWQTNNTPWESNIGNIPQPALVATMEKDEKTLHLLPKAGKAVVPGCGRGQDVEYLAQLGFECTGIDISQKAVEKAKEWLAGRPSDPSHSRVHFLQTDYFALAEDETNQDPGIKDVDLIYDYTFFCAIPPELHSKWAAAHAATLRPGGILFALVFPLRPEGNDSQEGPPYFVTPSLYEQLLNAQFDLLYLGDPLAYAPNRQGQEKIMLWRRK